MTKRLLALLPAVLIGLSVGCSSGGGTQADPSVQMPETGIILVIRNDVNTTFDCTIEAPGRPRPILGTVPANSTRTYPIDSSRIVAGFRVLCHRQSGQNLRSDPIRVINNATITYTLSTGLVRIQDM
jgi:hypothetical protein